MKKSYKEFRKYRQYRLEKSYNAPPSPPSILKIKVKRKVLLEKISHLKTQFAQIQDDKFDFITKYLKGAEKRLKNIGFSQPKYFKHDLLDIENYETYFNYFFHSKPIEDRDDIFFTREFNAYLRRQTGEIDVNNIDEIKLKICKRQFLDQCSQNLKSTKDIDDELNKIYEKCEMCNGVLKKYKNERINLQ